MTKTFLSLAMIILIPVCSVTPVFPQDGSRDASGAITTLYALDPITASLSLRDGKPGTVFQDYVAKNRDSQISFHVYTKDSFRVGIQGRDRGVIVDLGSDEELRTRYGFADTVGSGQGFASIHIGQGRGLIGKDYQSGQFQPLKEFDELGLAREDADVARVVLGHTYLVRIDSGRNEPLYAKLKVVAYLPGESVTIRWLIL